MERGYTRARYLKNVAALKAVRPGILITGDMIVGFPGESEDDFQQTLSMMKEVDYTDLFSFVYSIRSETKAAGFVDDLPYEVKLERLNRLQALQKQATIRHNKSFAGTLQEVLIEGKSKRGDQLFGRTDGNRMVHCTADHSLIGSLVELRIVKTLQSSLVGELP
jgi:tRNA-2-methylthio-N6-dimethylallyladenosine synthase